MKRVGVVGAGTSGLMACKYLLQKGFSPVVFEASGDIGGVWAHTLEATKLQTPRISYHFSDFPWPEGVEEEYPYAHQVMDYLHSYARHFDLLRYVRFHTRVVGIEFVGPSEEEMASWDLWAGNGEAFGGGTTRGVWHINTRNAAHCNKDEVYEVDFVILCLGKYSGAPNTPSFLPNEGPEVFNGKVMHSMELYNMNNTAVIELLKNKLVVVIGFMKTALDIAAECAKLNGVERPCTMIYRTNHWHFINLYAWGVNFGFLYFNRFAGLLFHKPGEGLLLWVLAMLLSPIRWMFSKFVESFLMWKLPMKKYKTVPNHSFFQETASSLIATLPENFYDRVEEGSVVLRKSENFSFHETGILTDDGCLTKPDVVIFATGFKCTQMIRDIFMSSTFADIVTGSSSTMVPLYRQCIHPRIPQLAIVGYAESLMNIHTSEIMCKWLVSFLDGCFRLPARTSMEKDVREWEEYMKRYTKQNIRRSPIQTVHTWYNDQLCRDMGCNPRRKKGVADWLIPYTSSDYKNVP